MLDLLRWYVVVQALGVVGLPYAVRFFRPLPDRGYAFARPLGLLAVGVVLWFGAIFGIWPNRGSMIALLALAIGIVGWIGLPRSVESLGELWRDYRNHLLLVEGLFLGAYLFWAFCRSFFPEIQATEKPMDFLFLNGILRSQRFPPIDPWLSGSSISYYYLGYLLVAVLTELSGVLPSVAFNLAIATFFALTMTGGFAVSHALVDGLRRTRVALSDRSIAGLSPVPSWCAGLLGAAFVALLGNWEGLLELLHAHGVGSASFWQWIGIKGLDHPFVSAAWYPTEPPDTWWWFRASRVIADYSAGPARPLDYTINEFPFFSFLLGDLHPHLMALPFAFVCLGFALALLRSPVDLPLDRLDHWSLELGFVAFLFGSLFLLNAWDILTYLFVLTGAFAMRRRLSHRSFDLRWLRQAAVFGARALVVGLVLYWPFYLTFRSQASGLLGVVGVHSQLHHFVIFWAPFLFLAGSLLIAELVFGVSPLPGWARRLADPGWSDHPLTWIGVGVIALASVLAGAPVLALTVPALLGAVALVYRYLGGPCGPPIPQKRPASLPADRPAPSRIAGGATAVWWCPEHLFVLLLLSTAALLLTGTELVYVQDSFNDRMNTVFKLYYQSWAMLAIVGAYTVFYLGEGAWARRGPLGGLPAVVGRRIWLGVAAVMVAGAFVYVPAALESRSQGFSAAPTLDGLAYYTRVQPEDAAAITWLNHQVAGTPVVVEATGGSYSETGNVAWMTGLPTILGWNFHEVQWRGASIVGTENERRADIDAIYRSTSPEVAASLLKKYHATYVYVGPIERRTYPDAAAGLAKFGRFMDVVYQNPGVTIFKVRGGG